MMEDKVKILQEVAEGRMSFIEAAALLAVSGGAEVDIQAAKLDLDRAGRCGFPEFVYGEGKSREQLRRIVPEIVDRTGSVLVTRIDVETGRELCMLLPEGGYDPVARTFFVRDPERKLVGDVAIVTAGSSDLGVALEALYTLEACGVAGELVTDVGVAGLERLLARIGRLRSADLCIVVAGMEGALPSVVGGLLPTPVIAVPTSVGYGAAKEGFTALCGMLSSCASGVTVVNIDNGFGAACAAARILYRMRNSAAPAVDVEHFANGTEERGK